MSRRAIVLFEFCALLCLLWGVTAKPLYAAQASPDANSAYVAALIEKATEQRLWESRQWLRLGHYRPTLLGGYESEVDGAAFFLHEEGKTSPDKELRATLRSLLSSFPTEGQSDKSAAQCRFPARLLWLVQVLLIDPQRLPQRQCAEFSDYLRKLNPASLTLVFSSYFLNNPASAFGHTFLRVNKRTRGPKKSQALLDYGIDFAATVDTDNTLVYALKGIFGMFPGIYSKIPYYYKVREYNDYESRDLWEYELDLSPQQVFLVLAHIWELGHTHFDYFYLSENCSYHILGALEVADPELELLEKLNWPVLPVDTLRALYKTPGLVRDLQFRPSPRTVFRQRMGALAADERQWVARLFNGPKLELPDSLAVSKKVRVLDAALDLADTKYAGELLKADDQRDESAISSQQNLLRQRAALMTRSQRFRFTPPFRMRPDIGHATRRLLLGGGWDRKQRAYSRLDFRLALHDMADPARGFPESMRIEFLSVSARQFFRAAAPRIEDITLVSVTSVGPWSQFEKPLSWSLRIGWDRIYDRGCNGCLAANADLGGGLSLGALSEGVIFYVLGVGEVSALAPIRNGLFDWPLRVGFGPKSGLRLRFTDDLLFHAEGRYLYLPQQDPVRTWSAHGNLRYQVIPNWTLGADGAVERGQLRAGLHSALYF